MGDGAVLPRAAVAQFTDKRNKQDVRPAETLQQRKTTGAMEIWGTAKRTRVNFF